MTPPSWLARTDAVIGMRSLPAVQKATLLMLAYHAGESWPKCWPKLRTLATETGHSESTVRRAIKGLRERGLVAVKHRWLGKERTSSEYTLSLPGLIAQGSGHSERLSPVRVNARASTMTAIEPGREPGTS